MFSPVRLGFLVVFVVCSASVAIVFLIAVHLLAIQKGNAASSFARELSMTLTVILSEPCIH